MKKTFLFTLLMALFLPFAANAQEVILLTGNISQELTSGTTYTFYDSGGESGNYAINESYTATFTGSGDITINFSSFTTESSSSCSNWDYMLVYDGDAANGTLLARGQTGCASSGIIVGEDIVASSGVMTIVWYSDYSTPAAGWVATIFAAGESDCERPSTIGVSEITPNGAIVEWDEGSGTYNVELKSAADTVWADLLSNSDDTSIELNDLSSLTTYQVRVQSVCDSLLTGWKSMSFTTAAGVPFVETFDATTIPALWQRKSGLLDDVLSGNAELANYSYGWYFGNNNGVFDSHARLEIYGTSTKHWLVTPAILIEENVQLSFDLALTKYSGTLFAVDKTKQADDKFVVLASTDEGETWEILRQWDNAGSDYVYNDIACSAAGQFVSIDLSDYADEAVMIAFYGESTSSSDDNAGDNYLHIDNVRVDYIPDCMKPTDLAVDSSTVTTSSFELSWTPNGDEEAWVMQYKKAADSIWVNVADTIDVNLYELSGLDASSVYNVRVAAWCDTEDADAVSEFSNAITMATECDAVIVDETHPFVEDFESYSSGSFDAVCWQNEHISGTGSSIFSIYTYTTSGNTTHQLRLPDMNIGTQTKLVLPQLNLQGDNYQFSIDVYRSNSTYNDSYADEGIRIFVSLDGEIEGATELAFIPRQYSVQNGVIPAVEETGWYTYELPIGVSGSCYIILRGESQYCSSTYMDNLKVEVIPACAKPSSLSVSDISAHSATLSWVVGDEETAWQIILNGDTANIIDADTVPFVLNNLPADSLFIVNVRANCESSVSDWANQIAWFRTLVACPAPLFSKDSVQNILTHEADLVWGGDADSYTVSYREAASVDGLNQDFENGLNGWTMVNCADGSGLEYSYAHSGGASFTFSYNSNPPQFLVSPQLETLVNSLSFYYKNRSSTYPETFQVGYSSTSNDTTAFTFGDVVTASDMAWHLFEEEVPTGTTFICVKYLSYDKFNLYIDDIQLGTEIPAGEWVVNQVEGNALHLDSLVAETTYEVKIQANCGEEGSSLESAVVAFSTVSDCQTPNGLEANEIAQDSAVISWNTYGLEAFNLRYSDDGENWVVLSNVTMPQAINDLTAGTTYVVQVQAACNTDEWSAELSFKTAYGLPFAPELTYSNVLYEWYRASILASSVFEGDELSGYSYAWSSTAANDVFEEAHLKLNIYGSYRKDWIVSPSLDLTNVQLAAGEQIQLAFRVSYNKCNYIDTPADTTGTDDKFIVAFSLDDGSTWNAANAFVWSNEEGAANVLNDIPTTGTNVSIDFSAAAGHMLRFAFYGESTSYNADNDIHVGDILLSIVNATDIRSIDAAVDGVKFIRDGHIYIRINGSTFDTTGRKVK